MSSFRDLKVWQEAHKLTIEIYKLTNKFPSIEKYRLTEQICKAVASISANIAEGTGRYSHKDFVKFLYVSRGSLEETRNFLILAFDLEYLTKQQYIELDKKCISISKMLNGLIKRLSNNNLQLNT
jgi:four helix bundle protein